MKRLLLVIYIILLINPVFAKDVDMDKTISIKFHDVELQEAIKMLGKQTGISFAYDSNLPGMKDKVNGFFENETITTILNTILTDKLISFKIVGDQVAIYKKKVNTTESKKKIRINIKGELRGYVYDLQTKESLIGVNIIIKNTTIGTVTDSKGFYTIPLLNPGSYTVDISYIGYEKQSVDITINEGAVTEKNFYLKYGSKELGEVTITIQAKGQVEAINQQLAANSIINIVAAERIQEVPDANVAESLGRLPGVSVIRTDGEGDQVVVRGLEPKFNLISINGIRSPSTDVNSNAVGLAGISPYMIESIEVQKSLTPDKDADVVGAIIDLKLKDAPEGWHGNLIFENSFNTLAKTAFNPRITIQGSNRFFHNKLGIILQGNYENVDRSSDRMNGDYILEGVNEEGFRTALVDHGNFSHYTLNRQRYGGSILLDYKLPEGKISLSSFLNGYVDEGWERTRAINSTWSTYENNNTIYERKNISYINSLSYEQKIFLNSKLEMGISYTKAQSSSPYWRNISQQWYGLTGLFDPIRNESVYALNRLNKNLEGQDSVTFMRTVSVAEEHFIDKEFSAQLNWKIPFIVSNNISGYIKTGGKYRDNYRKNDKDQTTFDLINGGAMSVRDAIPYQNPEINFEGQGNYVAQNVPTLNLIDESYSEYILGGQFYLNAFMEKSMVKQVTDRLIESNWVDNPLAYDQILYLQNDYEGRGRFMAGYLMADINLWRYFNIVGGVRYEQEKSDFQSWGISDYGQHNSDVEKLRDSTRQNNFLLPMVNLKIKPLTWFDIRLAYTQSLARSSYYKFMPRYYLTTLKDLVNTGNPGLKPALSHNFDISLSFHNNKLGLLTIGAFYKKIENFEYDNTFYVTSDSTNNVHPYNVEAAKGRRIYFPLNNPNLGTVKGIEVDWQTVFWYLPKPFNGLVFNINYTRMHSETQFQTVILNRIPGDKPWEFTIVPVDSTYSRPLIQQPNDVLNVSLGYDYKGFSARLAYNFKGKTLTGVGGSDTEKDRYSQNYQQWDLAVRQKLPWAGMQLSLNITNLSNSHIQDFRFIGENLPTREEYYGTMIILGLRFEL